MDKSVALVGLPGCGKSYIAQRLAEEYDLPCYDTDAIFEQTYGKLALFWHRSGEVEFRLREKKIAWAVLHHPPGFIALGGGTFSDPDVQREYLAFTNVVWLDATTSYILPQLDTSNRPMFKDRNPQEVLFDLAAKRVRDWSKAPYSVKLGAPEQKT